ncbi:hypothetical protein [Cupriavidus pauculus]|uniref:hypothetical protein n=1 Tax=Cupriavidus pauculus TaxID=82633 RepID=UPI001EE1FD7E|nr:hypothetical protein [Cupriavidus pauculus]GJG98188.1 hypothetical protein CBA19C6_26885 [Cupriavidus pauculus]
MIHNLLSIGRRVSSLVCCAAYCLAANETLTPISGDLLVGAGPVRMTTSYALAP